MVKVAIVGYGNIGKSVLEAARASADIELVGVVRRTVDVKNAPELTGVEVVKDIKELSVKPDVAILCTPTRKVPEYAKMYLSMGINTVDSYDIHTSIWELKQELDAVAKANGTVAVISAGWDPGSDSIVRTLMESCAP